MKIPRHLIDQLVQALAVPAGFVGSVKITINVHKGAVGKVVLTTEEVIRCL
jgi:hypothetical protein